MTSHLNKKVLALSSGGGHWIQLLRLKPAFDKTQIVFATVNKHYQNDVEGYEFRIIRDSNRCSKLALITSALSVMMLLLRERPDVVVTTGAAPGYFAVRIGKMLAIKTIWIDSIANAEELSLSGRNAGQRADLWLTQWPHLAKAGGPLYFGNVIQ